MVRTRCGHSLHTMVDGPPGKTLVVLEAGLGVSGIYWFAVQRLLRQQFRTVVYERAGFGASESATEPRTLAALADDLDAVIDSVDHTSSILVGHSWGGPIVRTAAATRLRAGRRDLLGMVLVDQSDENDPMFFSAATRRQLAVERALMVPLARVRFGLLVAGSTGAGLPAWVRRAVARASFNPRAARAAADEQSHLIEGLMELRDDPTDFGRLPIRVISAQEARWYERHVRAQLNRAHLATVSAHAGARYVPAAGVGHMVPTQRPDVIYAEVLSLARGVTGGKAIR